MEWLVSALGLVVVLLVLRDIFHTLGHPSGFGTLARLLFALTWRFFRAVNRRTGSSSDLAGPVGLLVAVAAWAVLLVVGWSVVYLPHMPEGFHFSRPPFPEQPADLESAAYLSLVAVTTLGLGDIVPADPVLRVLVPLEALVGFLLLTAAISWILQVYPALVRRRSLARRLAVLSGTPGTVELLEQGEGGAALLGSLTADLATVEMDLRMYGESYYFRERDRELSLAAQLPVVLRLVAAGAGSPSAEVRHAARVLEGGLAAFADCVAGVVGISGALPELVAGFAADHQQEQAAFGEGPD